MRSTPLLLTLAIPLPALAQDAPDAAQGFDAHGFVLSSHDGDVRDPLTLPRPGAFHAGDVFATGLLEFAESPLVQVTGGSVGGRTDKAALDDLVALNIAAGVAAHDHVRLDVVAPVYILSRGFDQYQQVGIGNVRVSTTVIAIRPVHVVGGGGLGVGFTGHVDLPTGDPARFLGNNGVAGGLTAAGTYEIEAFTATAALGMQVNPSVDLANLSNADALFAGAAIGWMFAETTGATAEVRALLPVQSADIAGTGRPAETLLSLRHHLPSGAHLTFGGAAGISQGAGAATYRAFAGIGFGKVEPPRDRDLDAIAEFNLKDQCPGETETQNGWRDEDGCPDDLGALEVAVTYADAPAIGAELEVQGPDGAKAYVVGDETISYEAVPGTSWHARAIDPARCLAGEAKTTVGESATGLHVKLEPVLDAKVRVEVVGPGNEPLPNGLASFQGDQPTCLPKGPLVLDPVGGSGETAIGQGTHKVVVDVPGYKPGEATIEVESGETEVVRLVLEPSLVVMTRTQIQILDKVHFEFNKAVIKSESFGLLNDVAGVIATHPDIGRVEVAGHTDDKGSDKYNQELSQKRAEAVRVYLIEQGVPEAQLIATGFGEATPIDTNKTEEGRSNNRRVEFNLIDQAAEPEGTPAEGTP